MFIVFSWWVNTCLFRRLGKVYDFSHCTRLCVLFSRVGDHVPVQMIFLPKWLVAFGTIVWFLFCVGDHVCLQVSKLHKCFLADFAFVGFFAAWVPMCCFNCPFSANDLSQTSHLNGFAPVWVSWCLLRPPRWVNDLLHCPHLKGLSPVWIRMCFIKTPFWPNDFPHWAHLCGFSPARVGKLIVRDVNDQILSQKWCSFSSCQFNTDGIIEVTNMDSNFFYWSLSLLYCDLIDRPSLHTV